MSLQEKLNAFKAAAESGELPHSLPHDVVAALHRATDELIATGQAGRAKRAGEVAPAFELEDSEGNRFALFDLLEKGPVVLTFYRGIWCPFCNMELEALEEARGEFEVRGARLLAISMQAAADSRRSIIQHSLGFPILVDPRGEIANAFGVRFALPDYQIELFKNFFQIDLTAINDEPSWTLPMPARYIIGRDGVIAYAEVNPDHTQRPEPAELLPTLDRLMLA